MVSEPYGGKLVERVLDGPKRESIMENLSDLQKIQVNRSTALDAELIAFGAFSPLAGFMGFDDCYSVISQSSLVNGLAWTIPIVLAPSSLEKSSAGELKEGDEAVLVHNDKPVALLHIEEKYRLDKKDLATRVYGTTDRSHPDVLKMDLMGEVALSGRIDLLNRVSDQGKLTPAQTRNVFQQKGWRTIAAFQTRNPPHVAHEYIQRCALELVDGLFIHPVVGELKADDLPPESLMESYEYMVDNFYPEDRVFLSPLPLAMRYAGPKAAVLLAIIRKNYGCTHFIVGRDIAGVGSYYEPYGAHELMRELDLGIMPMFFHESYYCRRCACMVTEKTCRHQASDHLKVSMTGVRKMIGQGERPPSEIMRPEIADLLMKYQAHLNGAKEQRPKEASLP
jgi:sulfate adenylyltransferase